MRAARILTLLVLFAGPHAPTRAQDAPSACRTALEARFVESAPRDRFELAVPKGGTATIVGLRLDLAGSAGDLVFDTEPGGDGVEVYQPFRIERGEALLRRSEPLADGGRVIGLDFDGFGAGERFDFSIDVDDRLVDSELGRIRVSGSEIEGASLRVDVRDAEGTVTTVDARFGTDAAAAVRLGDCGA